MRRIETVCLHTWFVWKMTNRNRTGDDAMTESPSSDEGNRVLMEWSYQGILQKAAAGRTVLLDEMFKPSKIGKLLCLGPVRWPPASLACTRLYAVHDVRCCARGARFVHDIMFFCRAACARSVRDVFCLPNGRSCCPTQETGAAGADQLGGSELAEEPDSDRRMQSTRGHDKAHGHRLPKRELQCTGTLHLPPRDAGSRVHDMQGSEPAACVQLHRVSLGPVSC